MLYRITEVEPLPEYRLRIRFEDGLCGVFDVSHLVGKGVFADWSRTEFFESVTIDDQCGTVVWPNGADLAPDTLYRRARDGDVVLGAENQPPG